MSISPAQLKEARRLLGWTLSVVGGKSDLSTSTISFFETGRRRPSALGVSKIRKAFEAAGVEFMNGGQPGARLAAFTVWTAVRMRRTGDPTLWRALTTTSDAPLVRSLPENGGGAGLRSRKGK
jgi:transcriptional regulator with XRE-family HTH domain